ncbi:MAG: MORN repeat-containing protein [Flavobacteriaceae bacterium]
MKTPKTTFLTYTALLLAVIFAMYNGFKANSLQKSLDESQHKQQQMESTIALADELFQIDSLLLKDNYREALHAYQEQKDEVGEFEDSRVELRIAVANKFVALNEGLSAQAYLTSQLNNLKDSAEVAVTPGPGLLQEVDSLQFALEKTKAQLARLKKQLSEKVSGTYLTFKSTKGSEVHYVGSVKHNMANGSGLALLSTGSRYDGQWKDNLRHGQGTFFWPDGEYYIGGYENDKRSGHGTYYWPNGEKFVGYWKDDRRNGEGTFYSKEGKVISGVWKEDKLVENYKKGKKKAEEQLVSAGR